MATFLAQLSPREESTFRRIVLGVPGTELRTEDVSRLAALGLVKVADNVLIVTDAGMIRYRGEPQSPLAKPPPRPRRLKWRSLPF
jgi:hypothetical protein